MTSTIKVMVVDDHPIFREGLRSLIERFPDIDIVAEADTAEAAMEALKLRPDVVLLDIRLPDVTGLELLLQIKATHPAIRIIVLSMHDDVTYLVDAMRAGANGYVLKGQAPELIPRAVYTVMEGGTVVEGVLLLRAMERVTPMATGTHTDLTSRELNVLGLLAKGQSNRTIAAGLNLAEITVKKHIQSLMQKLGTSDRTQTALAAVRLRLVD